MLRLSDAAWSVVETDVLDVAHDDDLEVVEMRKLFDVDRQSIDTSDRERAWHVLIDLANAYDEHAMAGRERGFAARASRSLSSAASRALRGTR